VICLQQKEMDFSQFGLYLCEMGHAVAWLIEALYYQPEDRGFHSQ
jgi:hypothetical protein